MFSQTPGFLSDLMYAAGPQEPDPNSFHAKGERDVLFNARIRCDPQSDAGAPPLPQFSFGIS